MRRSRPGRGNGSGARRGEAQGGGCCARDGWDAAQGDRGRRRFVGISAVRELGGVAADVLLLDRDLRTTFPPFPYQAAAGTLNAGDITYALRSFAGAFPNVTVRRACVAGLGPANRRVRLDAGAALPFRVFLAAIPIMATYPLTEA